MWPTSPSICGKNVNEDDFQDDVHACSLSRGGCCGCCFLRAIRVHLLATGSSSNSSKELWGVTHTVLEPTMAVARTKATAERGRRTDCIASLTACPCLWPEAGVKEMAKDVGSSPGCLKCRLWHSAVQAGVDVLQSHSFWIYLSQHQSGKTVCSSVPGPSMHWLSAPRSWQNGIAQQTKFRIKSSCLVL